MNTEKSKYLDPTKIVEHIDITQFNTIDLIEAMGKMAFQARNLSRAAKIYDLMLSDEKCSIILTLAGSIFSAGLKKVVVDLIRHNMVDIIVSTGAIIVDQDFFEALGFKHYRGTPFVDDNELRELLIDRIYDTYIDEEELRICDFTITEIASKLEPKPYSSREFIIEMGKYLVEKRIGEDSVVRTAYENDVPIFVPAFSDCSAGFGLIYYQHHKDGEKVTIDSVKDFLELTKLKIMSDETGLVMIGGGVPKNFAQDVAVGMDLLGGEVKMHKYAIQITVADERDGGLSGSTLKEACSWGKVDTSFEQMVFSEATIAFPLLASYAYHKRSWENRARRHFNKLLLREELTVSKT
ncbi:MAG: deoxyhypusine synthase [Ignavibacteria bacterium]|nr:deoxyhypusine synthase [Ignavibacteria bacterium]